MRLALLIFLLLPAASLARAAEFNPFAGPKPVAVLLETDPWAMVIGSDTPRVALYDDGTLLYIHENKDQTPQLLCAKLPAATLQEVLSRLRACGDLSTLRKHYDLQPEATDQPETSIFLALGKQPFVTTIYGLSVASAEEVRTKDGAADKRKRPSPPGAEALPEALQKIYKYLLSLSAKEAKPWTPAYVEAMVWDYDYAPEESIHWPADWPGLTSPQTIRRGDSFSIFLPGTELPRLREFLRTRKEKGAVEIDGKRWAVSYRYVFPSEPVWFHAFADALNEQGEE